MLMALRVHVAQEEGKYDPPSASLMPSWFSGEDGKLASAADPAAEEGDIHFADDVPENDERGHREAF